MLEFLIFFAVILSLFLFESDNIKNFLTISAIAILSFLVACYLYETGIIQEVLQNAENRERINVSKCK